MASQATEITSVDSAIGQSTPRHCYRSVARQMISEINLASGVRQECATLGGIVDLVIAIGLLILIEDEFIHRLCYPGVTCSIDPQEQS